MPKVFRILSPGQGTRTKRRSAPRKETFHHAQWCVVLACALSFVACNSSDVRSFGDPESERGSAKSALNKGQAPPSGDLPQPPVVVSLELTYPTGHGLDTATIGANGSLKVGPGARVLSADGRPGTVTNASQDSHEVTTLGPNAATGAIVSVADVLAGPNVTATTVTSSGKVTAGPGASLGAITERASLTPSARRSIIAHTAGAPPSDITVRANGASTLAPGYYRNVTIGTQAKVTLSAGTYIVEQFTLGNKAELVLDSTTEVIELYARKSATLAGTVTGDAKRFVLGLVGEGAVTISGGFRGTVLAPAGSLTLGPGGPNDVYEGTFYGKQVTVGPNTTVRKVGVPFFGVDIEGCVARIPVRDDLPPNERELTYQSDIARYCSAPGISSCQARLIGRANVDYAAAAAKFVSRVLPPAEYLAVVRDRTRKLRAAEDNGVLATQLCTQTDSDGDWVPDALDRCSDTPDLVATDDQGCTLTTLPAAPSAADVDRALSSMNLAMNPKCQGAPVPNRLPAGAFYWPDYRERGTYILAGAVLNQPTGCPVWYEFDIEEITGAQTGLHYSVAFMDREAKTNLVELGRPVPDGFVQFNPRPGDPGRDRLATTGGRARIRYRVRAMNGNGVRGPWSEYKVSDKQSCTALGFQCRDE